MPDTEQPGLRITTWNVNGIRNPFGYQPWRQERTFAAMFDLLEADIVVMQETKIQRKDLRDEMVLVPGWDVFFSLPKHKKGYSGVAIYTRNAVCAPIRAEEGITGVLTPPNSTTSFRDLPPDQQIGGYPGPSQLALDAATLDSEGRCVVLEFPAFVLIGTYCPATRDESRDEFRLGFLNALDARVRSLVAAGKRVFLTGDLNIIRGELDVANLEEIVRKQGITSDEFISTPARRMLNQLLVDGKVIGARDEGRAAPVMIDLCRSFHPTRRGMFTCWDQKMNARPGNFGSRIDYVLCSADWKDWFYAANIQEGLMGSDHCPVYAVLKERVEVDGREVYTRDLMSSGLFKDGIRQRDWSARDLLPMSAKLIPEFDRRRSIRDMFKTLPGESSVSRGIGESSLSRGREDRRSLPQGISTPNDDASRKELQASSTSPKPAKRLSEAASTIRPKRGKSTNAKSTRGQSSLMGFFKPKGQQSESQPDSQTSSAFDAESDTPSLADNDPADQETVVDPIVAKESWSKLLGGRVVPRCEHNEPCISLVTKKPGANCGRSFYMCPRPLGPSGQKEKNSQWRCGTFIWSSDWGDGVERGAY